MRITLKACAVTLVTAALMFTAGCVPRWAVTATRYAESISLYSVSDPSQQVTQAAAGQHFLIVGMELQYSAAQPADIRDQLIFGLYDCYGDDVRYNNNNLYVYFTSGTDPKMVFIPTETVINQII